MKVEKVTEHGKIVLVEHREPTDLERARNNDKWRLVKFFVDARCYNRIGDILLTHEARLEDLIDRHIAQYYKPKTEEEVREYRRHAK